jgi:hypothetical protein
MILLDFVIMHGLFCPESSLRGSRRGQLPAHPSVFQVVCTGFLSVMLHGPLSFEASLFPVADDKGTSDIIPLCLSNRWEL